ncbi:AAA family ATPase [Myxococcus sp. AM001]|nr:AAA family ATPase [Myxococcus sp. AM001]
MIHLTARVAWHDGRWNGTVCTRPGENAFCTALERVRKDKNDTAEMAIAGRAWADLAPEHLPPCIAEGGGFMSQFEWSRRFTHPYTKNRHTVETHGHLLPTTLQVPTYSTFAVPFRWMLRRNQEWLESRSPEQAPEDVAPPFPSPWVFGRERQEWLVRRFFEPLTARRSLLFLYCKEGHPLGGVHPRLIVAIGHVVGVDRARHYDSSIPEKTYAMWDRVIRHSIREDGVEGFLFPYHDYLAPTGDPDEDRRRLELLHEIAVAPDASDAGDFSYAAEHTRPDIVISILGKAVASVQRIRAHGIASGPWERRESWLNAQIAAAWKDRGAFPGFGAALEALGFRLGSALALELVTSGMLKPGEDPWPLADALFRGKRKPPRPEYASDIKELREIWTEVSGTTERFALLKLLSRFDLEPEQAQRWFEPESRRKLLERTIPDKQLLENPYLLCELDVGGLDQPQISIGTIDRGLLPEDSLARQHPLPTPSGVETPSDKRRVRAGLVAVLRQASEQGDSLVSTAEMLERLPRLDVAVPIQVTSDWFRAHGTRLSGTVELVDAMVRKASGEAEALHVPALQLTQVRKWEDGARKILAARAERSLPSLGEDWRALIVEAIGEAGGRVDPRNERHQLALTEQAAALEKVTTRKLSVLAGRAGTGKTSVLGALLRSKKLNQDGILLLAPTGKARVRLSNAANRGDDEGAATVAQFLYRLKRYDALRQKPRTSGTEKHRREKTVVIDECSMLTLDDLYALLDALDLNHVQRLILVGDPNQLPPIGVGRPFADFVGFIDECATSDKEDVRKIAGALGRLSIEVRAQAGAPSDTLRLASWFTREAQPVDSDRVLSDLELCRPFNDLEICFWKTTDELHQRLLEQFQKHLGIKDSNDAAGFNRALGFNENNWIPYEDPSGPERFQLLSPVRMQPHGVHELNRWVQKTFRKVEVEQARSRRGLKLGDEEIVLRDKVLQVRNQTRDGYDYSEKSQVELYIANGEIGIAANTRNGWMNVAFAGRPNVTVGYGSRDFSEGSGPLQLAYALTVHKSQGSKFNVVFAILPKHCRLLSRELLYTMLTRSKKRMVLLLEAGDTSVLYDLTRPERSETARRNSNLFLGAVRERSEEIPYAEHLIHRTLKGHMVRSKSELVIANLLHSKDIAYEYERVLEGTTEPGRLRPDFTFVDAAGDLIIWEHLGMLDNAAYSQSWNWKRQWYAKNGFIEDQTLFITRDEQGGRLDAQQLEDVAERIRKLL